jgi:alanyl-tRNA synthetase
VVIREDEFAVPFFKENGFSRKKCETCGTHYWTQVAESKNCGDAPCQEYTFIGNPPTRGSHDLNETRKLFLSFFERNHHKIIDPYPIIARWRSDVYFVGASIFDFQPYVTEGINPPPANPLVISQPCLRFTDLDNVGPTAGRHLVIFEMGGAHAFNYPDKNVYWKDQTIRYHHELLTKHLGVRSEKVTYKEDFWRGGGNAGPDIEACVDGLEISTLVFMSYKIVNRDLVEMPIKTVDTGYGIERWTWLSKGSPSGFHAIYGSALDKIMNLAGVNVDDKMLIESSKLSGIMNVGVATDKIAARKKVADRLGMDWGELDRVLTPVESAYAIADHMKALSFMLSEGVVASNVKEGYLARLLMRRTYRMLKLLGIEDRLSDLIDLQISLWSKDFPNIGKMRGEILAAISVEEKKFKRTLEKGSEVIKKVCDEVKSEGKKELSQQSLIELYDSHGMVPDIVKDLAQEQGVNVDVPGNFYGIVAARHSDAPVSGEAQLEKKLEHEVSGLPDTRPLYYEDQYRTSFKGKILASFDKYVVLDQTLFYPESGGQVADSGVLLYDGKQVNVLDAQKIGKVIVHLVEGKGPPVGAEVEGRIDWERRASLMRHHTATHVLIGAARRILGEHAWQAGAKKDVDKSRLDISHYERLTEEQVRALEDSACRAITQDIPVDISWMPREKAEAAYGFRLYQGGAVPGREIRVVKMGEWDVEACGGTHCTRTGEIGFLKLLHVERPQDGVERLIFATGPQALKYVQDRESILEKTAQTLDVPVENLNQAAEELVNKSRDMAKIVERFRSQVISNEAQNLLKNSKKIGEFKLAMTKRTTGDEDELIMLTSKITETDPLAVAIAALVNKTVRLFVSAGKESLKKGVDAGKLAGTMAKVMDGGGGGKPYFGQGGGTALGKVDEALKFAEESLRKLSKLSKTGENE